MCQSKPGHARSRRVHFAIMAGVSLCLASALPAHDFWVEPEHYWIAAEVGTSLTLQVGHGPSRQRSPIRIDRIARFEAITPDGSSIDMRPDLHPGGAADDGGLQFRMPGTYMLVLATDNRAQSHLPALRFNDYLQAEGLTPALEQRAQTHRTDVDGSESYSRVAKSIIRIEPSDTGSPGHVARPSGSESQPTVTRPIGLPLEIVPEQSPYAEPRGEYLPVRVLYEGQPLKGALVKLTDLAHDAEPFETHTTDAEGRAIFTLPKQGRWLLNVVWTKPLPHSRETDFETVFSSLSFGFPDGHPGSP